MRKNDVVLKTNVTVDELAIEFLAFIANMLGDNSVRKYKINNDRIYPSDNILYNDKFVIVKVDYIKPLVDEWVNGEFIVEGKELFYRDWLDVIVSSINERIIFTKKRTDLFGHSKRYCYNGMKMYTCNSDRYIKLFIDPMSEAINRNIHIAIYDGCESEHTYELSSGTVEGCIVDYKEDSTYDNVVAECEVLVAGVENKNKTIISPEAFDMDSETIVNENVRPLKDSPYFNFISGISIQYCKPFSKNTYIGVFDVYMSINRNKKSGFDFDSDDSVHIHVTYIFNQNNIEDGTLSVYQELNDGDGLRSYNKFWNDTIKEKIISLLNELK